MTTLSLATAMLWGMTTTTTRAADAVVGDSIAKSVGAALGLPTQARVGAGSCEIAGYITARTPWDHLVISAGINDGGRCVAALRAEVHARRVIWVLPAPINPGRAAVIKAMRPGDGAVSYSCPGGCSRVSFHPASPPAVARAIRNVWNTN